MEEYYNFDDLFNGDYNILDNLRGNLRNDFLGNNDFFDFTPTSNTTTPDRIETPSSLGNNTPQDLRTPPGFLDDIFPPVSPLRTPVSPRPDIPPPVRRSPNNRLRRSPPRNNNTALAPAPAARRTINKYSQQVYTTMRELLQEEYTTNEQIDTLIQNFNTLNIKTTKSPSKTKNYKIGYQKRLNNKIYIDNDIHKQSIYNDTKEEVGKIYTFIKNFDVNNTNAPCDLRNLVEKFTAKKKEYLAKILKDYRDNRGDCQNNFELDFENDFSDVLTKFQEDSDGKKYIFSDQILRSYSFKNGDSKASDARKGTLKLNESSTRLVQRERNIFNNMRLFILDNSDDQDMKEWYEDPKVKRFIQQKRLKNYETLKNEWNEWKRKYENRNFGTNFYIRNQRLYVKPPEESYDDIFDKEYVNFDEFLKGEDFIGKLKEIYQTDLTNFLKFNGLYDKKVGDNIEYLISRYDLQRKDRKKELGNIIIFDNRRDYLKIPAVQQGEIRRRCSNGFRMSKRMNEAQEPVKECLENISKKIGLIKFSKSPRKKSPKQ